MIEVLYTKFNSYRQPKYRVSTSIVQDGKERYVLKKAMAEDAQAHLENMVKNYRLLSGQNDGHIYVPCELENGYIKVPYVIGDSITKSIDYVADSIENLVGKLQAVFDKIFSKADDNIHEFHMSEEFEHVFPNCNPKNEYSYSVTNLDAIPSNFIETDGNLFCIDYEWVCTYDIPVSFVKLRSVFYWYQEHHTLLSKRFTCDEIFEKLGYSHEKIELFKQMEECFQQHVHGENRKWIYISNYEKPSISFDTYQELLKMKDNHIGNLDQQIDNLNQQVDNAKRQISDANLTIDNLNRQIHDSNQHIANVENIMRASTEHNKHLLNENKKLTSTLVEKEEMLAHKDLVIGMQEEFIRKVKKSIKNPFYGGYLVCRKLKNKVFKKKPDEQIDSTLPSTEESYARQRQKAYEELKHLVHSEQQDYEKWITEIENAETYDETFDYNPKISILVPVYNVLDKHLIPCIESVINQVYTNWELCLADDASTWESVRETLKKYENHDKIKVVYRSENGHISRCTNSALDVATGEYVAFLDCDDVLRPNALYEVIKKLNENSTYDLVYSDEDKIDDDGKNRHMPHFKPDWSPDTLMSHMYICHFSVYRAEIARKIGGLRAGYEGAQDYDFALRFTEQTDRIAHIPKILYHWRERVESTAVNPDAKPYILEAAKKSKMDAVERRGLKAEYEHIDIMHQFRVNYISQYNSKVSIIIPSKDNFDILSRCLRSIVDKTLYKNYEIVVVDNGSNDENRNKCVRLIQELGVSARYIYEKATFNFSYMCNKGAGEADGELLLFLNDDTEVIDGEWLQRMVGHAELSHAGAVGAKLLYPESKEIQHVGVINIANGPCHAFAGMSDEPIYYFGRNRLDYNYVAVTAACMMIGADKFRLVGGFNEDLAVAYNDVELCFRLVEHGFYNVVRNDVKLYHYESVSRGDDRVSQEKMVRLMNEQNKLYSLHPSLAKEDPFYNSNLTQRNIDFSVNMEKHIRYEKPLSVEKEYTDADQMVGVLDECRVSTYVRMSGWVLNQKLSDNNHIATRILIQNNVKSYMFGTTKVYRPDVGDAYLDNPYCDFCGFECNIMKEDIEQGVYQIYLVLKDERLLMPERLNILTD